MSADIGPGDFVECIINELEMYGLQETTVGNIYRVRLAGDTGTGGCVPGCIETIGLLFDGDDHDATGSHCLCAYRPVYRPTSTFIDSLKQPAPERELETA